MGPKWFLHARGLQFPNNREECSPPIQKLAREALSDYFREVVSGETQPHGDRAALVHPSIAPHIDKWKQSPDSPLRFSAYSEDGKIRPCDIVDDLMDYVKGKLRPLDEWVYFPWKQTLLGLFDAPLSLGAKRYL